MDIILPQFGSHKFRHCWFYFVRPEATNDDHLVQLIQFLAPGFGHRSVAGVFAVINRPKVFALADETLPCVTRKKKQMIKK